MVNRPRPVQIKEQDNERGVHEGKWLATMTGLVSIARNDACYVVSSTFKSTASTEDVFEFDINDSTDTILDVPRNGSPQLSILPIAPSLSP